MGAEHGKETWSKSGRGRRRDKHWEPCVHRTVLLFPVLHHHWLLWGKPDRKENIQTSTGSREVCKARSREGESTLNHSWNCFYREVCGWLQLMRCVTCAMSMPWMSPSAWLWAIFTPCALPWKERSPRHSVVCRCTAALLVCRGTAALCCAAPCCALCTGVFELKTSSICQLTDEAWAENHCWPWNQAPFLSPLHSSLVGGPEETPPSLPKVAAKNSPWPALTETTVFRKLTPAQPPSGLWTFF